MVAPRSHWSEERIHRWLARLASRDPALAREVLAGARGNDAAVLRRLGGRPVLCTDQTVEGVHFDPGVPPRRVGEKAVGRALSDLAATAARPVAVLLALSAPPATSEAWIRAAISAVAARAQAFGALLVGGDLSLSRDRRALVVSALGSLEGTLRPPGRERAREGQLVLLTGPVGGSRLGRHLRIEPRLEAGRRLHAAGATALIDVSDGLALDAARLARASGVRIEIEEVPVHPDARRLARRDGRSAWQHALSDGEDHELIATLAPAAWRRSAARLRRACRGLAVIGRVRTGAGLWIPDGPGAAPARWSGEGGWIHGG